MRSLRSRLILGVSIVALVPLALAMYLLSRRIEGMVREQASVRLEAALGRLVAGLHEEGVRIRQRLEILAQDPGLKRAYLIPGGRQDLTERIADARFLLGLDFLHLQDVRGGVVSDASRPGRAADDLASLHNMGAGPQIARIGHGSGLILAAGWAILYEGNPAGTLRGGLDLDASFLTRLARANSVELVLAGANGVVFASTLADSGARGWPAPMPANGHTRRVEVGGVSYWSRSEPLGFDPSAARDDPSRTDTWIIGLVPTAAADTTIRTLQITSLLLALLGLAVAIGLGVFWSSQVSRPVEQLAAESQRIARGEWDEPVRVRSVRELETLVEAFERMRADLATYRERLVRTERQAAWGQMARMVAHEIKNPLTPIAVSVADLKRSFERDRADFPAILDQAVRTIAGEVDALKRILQEFSDFARLPAPVPAPCRVADFAADLEALYAREVAAGRLTIAPGPDVIVSADRGQIRQALVNLVQNGLEAIGPAGRVAVSAAADGAVLEIAVSDDGPGLGSERMKDLFVPDLTTKARGTGLGLVIVQKIVGDHGGTITAESAPGRGTTFRVRLPLESPARPARGA